MKAKITSFLTSYTSSSLPYFLRTLNNFYSRKVFKSEYSSTWDFSWLLTVYLFFITYSVMHNSFCVDLKFLSTRKGALLWEAIFYLLRSGAQGWGTQKVNIIVFQIIWVFIDYDIRSLIHPSLDIIYDFRLDACENRLCYIYIELHLTLFIQRPNDTNYLP